MRIVSFNVNGLRARPHQLERLVELLSPDIIGLQEIKVRDEEFPADLPQRLGYHAEWFGQPTHYGVALLSRTPPIAVRKGLPGDHPEAQRRLIAADYATPDGSQITVVNGYFPQGESRDHPQKFPAKRAFYAGLLRHLREDHSPEQRLAVVGDMNIAPVDADIGIGPENAKRWLKTGKCSFLPEEREWMGELLGWGLTDCFRARHPEIDDRFSWFDYRSKGFEQAPKRGLRIDLILASAALAPACQDSGIDYEIRGMERPSDHCPVWADFAL